METLTFDEYGLEVYWSGHQREMYVRELGSNDEFAQVDYGWWNGCGNCGAYEEEIKSYYDELDEEEKDDGEAACAFALSVLTVHGGGSFLCEECSKGEEI